MCCKKNFILFTDVLSRKRFQWFDCLNVNGTCFDKCPYLVGDKIVMECHHGPDRNKAHKQQWKLKKEQQVVGNNACTIYKFGSHV